MLFEIFAFSIGGEIGSKRINEAPYTIVTITLCVFTVDPERVILAEDHLYCGEFPEFQTVWYDIDTGLHEMMCEIRDGLLRIGTREIVICFLGRSDVLKSRNFPTVVEKFIQTCKQFRSNTIVVMGGPFPSHLDGERAFAKFNRARLYLEDRLTAEPGFAFCRSAERFTCKDGIRCDLLNENGLTERGREVLLADIMDAIHESR